MSFFLLLLCLFSASRLQFSLKASEAVKRSRGRRVVGKLPLTLILGLCFPAGRVVTLECPRGWTHKRPALTGSLALEVDLMKLEKTLQKPSTTAATTSCFFFYFFLSRCGHRGPCCGSSRPHLNIATHMGEKENGGVGWWGGPRSGCIIYPEHPSSPLLERAGSPVSYGLADPP